MQIYRSRRKPLLVSTIPLKNKPGQQPLQLAKPFVVSRTNASPRKRRQNGRNVNVALMVKRATTNLIKPNSSLLVMPRSRN